VSPLTIALTSEASTWALLMLGFGGFGFAAFSVGMKLGQIAKAAWRKGKLREALTSAHEPPQPRQMSLVASAEISATAFAGLVVSCSARSRAPPGRERAADARTYNPR